MKKEYQKPRMKVFDIKPSQILCGSAYPVDGPLGYSPGTITDMNKLA